MGCEFDQKNNGFVTGYDIYEVVNFCILFEEINIASNFLDFLIEKELVEESNVSMKSVRKLLEHVRYAISDLEVASSSGAFDMFDIVDRFTFGQPGSFFELENASENFHFFRSSPSASSFSSFEQDFVDSDSDMIRRLREKGFARSIPEEYSQLVFRAENVRVSMFSRDLMAVVDADGVVLRSASARLARIMPKLIVKKAKDIVPEAIFLPIPYAVTNYFHVFSEMLYALRFLSFMPDSIPVVYSEDYFNVIPIFVRRLGLDPVRFVSFSDFSETLVKKALLIDKPGHFWSRDFFNFFNFSVNQGRALKRSSMIYISRSKSSRSFHGETEVEDFLRDRGFDIIHAENLSIAAQIRLFETASKIVAPHGAGLTNILFSAPGIHLLEIFNHSFVHPDFYLRSRHNDIKYYCHVLPATDVVDFAVFVRDFEIFIKM